MKNTRILRRLLIWQIPTTSPLIIIVALPQHHGDRWDKLACRCASGISDKSIQLNELWWLIKHIQRKTIRRIDVQYFPVPKCGTIVISPLPSLRFLRYCLFLLHFFNVIQGNFPALLTRLLPISTMVLLVSIKLSFEPIRSRLSVISEKQSCNYAGSPLPIDYSYIPSALSQNVPIACTG